MGTGQSKPFSVSRRHYHYDTILQSYYGSKMLVGSPEAANVMNSGRVVTLVGLLGPLIMPGPSMSIYGVGATTR
jgi:hypothetical protein